MKKQKPKKVFALPKIGALKKIAVFLQKEGRAFQSDFFAPLAVGRSFLSAAYIKLILKLRTLSGFLIFEISNLKPKITIKHNDMT